MGFWSVVGPALAGAGAGGALSFIGQKMADDAADRRRSADERLQREFAQNGIRWRVEDARRAGLHPLIGAGSSPSSYSPSYSVGSGVSSAVSDMGQDISRAIAATRNSDERKLMSLNLERAGLENDLLRAQIGTYQRDQVGPPFPNLNYYGLSGSSGGRGSPPMPGSPWEDQSMTSDVTYSRTAGGGLHPVMPPQLSESLEADELLGALDWSMRNKVQPALGSVWNRTLGKLFGQTDMGKPSKYRLPKGAIDWEFHLTDRSWHPVWGKGRDSEGYLKYKRRN